MRLLMFIRPDQNRTFSHSDPKAGIEAFKGILHHFFLSFFVKVIIIKLKQMFVVLSCKAHCSLLPKLI